MEVNVFCAHQVTVYRNSLYPCCWGLGRQRELNHLSQSSSCGPFFRLFQIENGEVLVSVTHFYFLPGSFLKAKVAQSCPTLCNPMDYTVYGILQARILEWVAFCFSRGSSQPSDWTQVSLIAGEFFTSWATKEDLKPLYFRHLLIEKRQKPVSLLPLMLISFFCRNSHIVSLSTLPWASQVALVVKNPPANAEDVRDVGSIPGSERSSRGGNNNPL